MEELRVSVTATSDRFAVDDDRWLSQVRLLHEDLGRETPLVTGRPVAVRPGTKGGWLPDVAVLLSPAVVAGVVAVVKAWLVRDRDRTVHLAWEVNGRKGEFTATASTADNATLQAALEHGLRAAAGTDAGAVAESAEPGASGGSEPDGTSVG
ncbi:effector-associated constant component EACC1 [Streptomyces sp. NPDC001002]